MENDKKIGKVRLTISEGYLIMVVTGIGQMFDEQKFIGEQERSMSIYDTLNEPQREAVLHTDGPLLILAGAGSGKTRVLTHRIAYLIDERGVNPWNILAITFTNKAAGEMRQRVDSLVNFGAESIWVSTFHSACVRILRRFIDRLGYDNRFTIYDTDDQKTLMKEVCRKVDIDTKYIRKGIFWQRSRRRRMR